jgi:Arylsulfotransferase (ASST)
MRSPKLIAVGAAALAAVGVGRGLWLVLDGEDSAGAQEPEPLTQHFLSRPDLRPPLVEVARTGPTSAGYIFLAPKKDVAQAGPMIVADDGRLVWFHPLDTHGVADFRVQRYGGRPVLTWWRGRADKGVGDGYYVIMSNAYREIAQVRAGNGLAGDIHEFLITPRDTALLTVYHRLPRNLSAVGGPKQGSILEGIVQEIDIATGRVLFEWHSADHVAVDESYAPPPKAAAGAHADPYDYFHINSIDRELDGSLLVSARNTRTVYEIRRPAGAIVWRLGGKKSDFAMGPGTRFAWQHDARRRPDGTITLFDNGAEPKVENRSRVLVLRLDPARRRATLVRSYVHPRGVLAGSQGNAQFLPDGHVFVGWGAEPYFTEFDRAGRVVLDGHFGTAADSYRVFRFRWRGQPAERPAAVASRADDGTVRVSASWNGATDVARWQVRAGDDAKHLEMVATTAKKDFDTTITLANDARTIQVRALDHHGAVLGTSAALSPS